MSRNFANPIQGAEQFDSKDDTILHILPLVCRTYSAELVIFVCVFRNEGSLSIRNYRQGPVPVNKELLTGIRPCQLRIINRDHSRH